MIPPIASIKACCLMSSVEAQITNIHTPINNLWSLLNLLLSRDANNIRVITPQCKLGKQLIAGVSTINTTFVIQYNIPLLSPSASLDDFTVDSSGEVVDTAWRVAYSDSYQGEALAQFAVEEFGATKAAILGDNSSDYAVGLVTTFEESFPGEVVITFAILLS